MLLADAPTGTGKSAAYLAPAILDVASGGGRVVVSTATLALQVQLLSEDLPPMKAAAAELVSNLEFPGRQAARTAIFEYLETFYNARRLHSSLGYRSPADFEEDRMGEARVA